MLHTEQKSCGRFGEDRSQAIHDLIKASTGAPCPGRLGGQCPLEGDVSVADDHAPPRLRGVAS